MLCLIAVNQMSFSSQGLGNIATRWWLCVSFIFVHACLSVRSKLAMGATCVLERPPGWARAED